jgi:hypothetical protein
VRCIYAHYTKLLLTPISERPIKEQQTAIVQAFDRERARANTPPSPALLKQIKVTRRELVANKTRERERERRGEVTARTLLRRRKGPPAHVLATMTPEQRRLDAAARSVSEVGFAGLAKRKLGHGVKSDSAWMAESGKEKDRERLDLMARAIESENARRRQASGTD